MTPASFAAYADAVYARPGVAEACIRLQDELGLDVNVLLYGLYAAANGRAFGAGELAALDAATAPWRTHVVAPLRAVRRWLKAQASGDPNDAETADAERLRRDVLALELASERRQQRRLASCLPLDEAPMRTGAETDADAETDVDADADAVAVAVAVAANLRACLAFANGGSEPDARQQQACAVLLAAAADETAATRRSPTTTRP